jgi:flagellin
MLSINTNKAALTALQNLASTSTELDHAQRRISTGLRVGSASDNAAYWSIATTMSSDNSSLSTVKDALNLGSATIDTANAGLTAAKDLVVKIKDKLTAAVQPGVDKTKVQDELTELQKQLKSVADSATFSGQNWLSVDSTAAGYNANRDIVGSFTRDGLGQVTIQTIGVDITTVKLFDDTPAGLAAATAGSGTSSATAQGVLDKQRTIGTAAAVSVFTMKISTLTDSPADTTMLTDYVKVADTTLKDIIAASSTLGASKARVTTQQSFVDSLSSAIKAGVGALTDADMTEESTRLQALQVQQQLGVQSLSIANQNTQTVLSLFK